MTPLLKLKLRWPISFCHFKQVLHQSSDLGYLRIRFDLLGQHETLTTYFAKAPKSPSYITEDWNKDPICEHAEILPLLLRAWTLRFDKKKPGWQTWCIRIPDLTLTRINIVELSFYHVNMKWRLWQPKSRGT